MVDLNIWRKRIDALDEALVRLLNERARCATEIARVKRKAGLPLHQPEREQEVLARVERLAAGHLTPAQLRTLFEAIVRQMRELERAEIES